MITHLKSAKDDERSDTLLVFLPGAYLKPDEFEREGFISAVRERHLAADSLLVDADVSYYYDQTLSERLHADVIEPQRAKGYKSIWLVGISIGGFGALIHELSRPGSVDGIVALAPYLGRRVLCGAWFPGCKPTQAGRPPHGACRSRPPARRGSRPQAVALVPAVPGAAEIPEPAPALPWLRPQRPLCQQPQAAGGRPARRPRLHDRRRPRLAAMAPTLAQCARRAAATVARPFSPVGGYAGTGRGVSDDVISEAMGHRGLTSKA